MDGVARISPAPPFQVAMPHRLFMQNQLYAQYDFDLGSFLSSWIFIPRHLQPQSQNYQTWQADAAQAQAHANGHNRAPLRAEDAAGAIAAMNHGRRHQLGKLSKLLHSLRSFLFPPMRRVRISVRRGLFCVALAALALVANGLDLAQEAVTSIRQLRPLTLTLTMLRHLGKAAAAASISVLTLPPLHRLRLGLRHSHRYKRRSGGLARSRSEDLVAEELDMPQGVLGMRTLWRGLCVIWPWPAPQRL